jgi:hypothetical protein
MRPSWRTSFVLLTALALFMAATAFAGATTKRSVHARLQAVAPVTHATGSFSANGSGANSVVVRWQLSVSKLSGAVKTATLQTPGPRKITFTLCKRCAVNAHGQLVLLGSVWKRIAAGGGSVVVGTKAHPRGELRGTLRRG